MADSGASGDRGDVPLVWDDPVGGLAAAEVHRLATFLAHAFKADPMQRWLFPRDDRRIGQIAEVMARDIAHRIAPSVRLIYGSDGHSVAFMERHLGPISATNLWRAAPTFASLAARRAVRAWRMLRLVDARHRDVGPHLYLMHLAVAEPHRGHGRADALLDYAVGAAEDSDVGVYLETANPQALPLYERHGVHVLDEIRLPTMPPVWTLWRPPPTARSAECSQG